MPHYQGTFRHPIGAIFPIWGRTFPIQGNTFPIWGTKTATSRAIANVSISSHLNGGREPQKWLSGWDAGLVALDLAGFFKVAIAPVGMWKSGGGWASRWAGVFLPVHGLVHALEPRSRHGSIVPGFHISTGRAVGGRDAAKKGRPPWMADSLRG